MNPKELFWRRLRRALQRFERLNITACLQWPSGRTLGGQALILRLRCEIARLKLLNFLLEFRYDLRLAFRLWITHIYFDQPKPPPVVFPPPDVNASDRHISY